MRILDVKTLGCGLGWYLCVPLFSSQLDYCKQNLKFQYNFHLGASLFCSWVKSRLLARTLREL